MFEKIKNNYYNDFGFIPMNSVFKNIVSDIYDEIKSFEKFNTLNKITNTLRVEQVYSIFKIFLNSDMTLRNNGNQPMISFIDRFLRHADLSIQLEDRMFKYFKRKDYEDNNYLSAKIRFLARDGDKKHPGLTLNKVIDNPLSSSSNINITNNPSFTGYGYLLINNKKITGYLNNGWFEGKVKINDEDNVYWIDNYESHFDEFIESLIIG